MSSRCSRDLLGAGEVGLGGDGDLDGAAHLGQLGDEEPVAGPDPLVGGEAHRDHVDLRPGGRHQVVEPLAEQRPRPVQAGGVDQDQLGVGAVHDAAHHGAGGLRLVGAVITTLVPTRALVSVDLPALGRPDERGEPAAVVRAAARSSALLLAPGRRRSRPRSARRSCPRPCRPARRVRGRRRAAAGRHRRASSPSRRTPSRQPPLAHQVLADRPHLRGLPGHPEVPLAGGQSIPSTTAARSLASGRRRAQPGDVGAPRAGSRTGRRAPRPRSASAGRRAGLGDPGHRRQRGQVADQQQPAARRPGARRSPSAR